MSIKQGEFWTSEEHCTQSLETTSDTILVSFRSPLAVSHSQYPHACIQLCPLVPLPSCLIASNSPTPAVLNSDFPNNSNQVLSFVIMCQNIRRKSPILGIFAMVRSVHCASVRSQGINITKYPQSLVIFLIL